MRKELKRVRADLESFEAMTEITKAKYERKVEELKRQLQSSYDQADGQSGEREIQCRSAVVDLYERGEHSR